MQQEQEELEMKQWAAKERERISGAGAGLLLRQGEKKERAEAFYRLMYEGEERAV